MKRFSLTLIAIASLAWAGAGLAETRPHYGGTLRVAIREAPQRSDPKSGPAWLSQLVFENLVRLNHRGRPQPWLATSWQAEPGNQRWRFLLRSGVSFHDGTPLDANAVAASLRASNSQWKVLTTGESVMIETDSSDPMLPAELALSRNGIMLRAGSKVSGTGPFAIRQWDPGKHALLTAHDQYWQGRPFLDAIEVEFGKNSRDRMMALELDQSDVIQVEPEAIRRAQAGSRLVIASQPDELMALVFAHDPRSDGEIGLRNAFAMSIDSAALNNVVFQGGGEQTGALLPNWLSGYAFVFPSGVSGEGHLPKGRPPSVSWTLSYDPADPMARIVSERVLLNAKDAGIMIEIITAGTADLHLVRVPLPSCDPETALDELARDFELPPPKFTSESVNALYAAENAMWQTHRVIPLLHLRTAVAMRPGVHGIAALPEGTIRLDDAWLSPEKP